MKKRLHEISLYLVVTLLCVLMLPMVVCGQERRIDHVFVVAIDGLSYEGFESSAVPNLKHLAGEGVMDEKCLAVRTDTTESAQVSVFTGAPPEQHKYYSTSDQIQMASILDMLKQAGRTFCLYDGTGGKLNAFNYGESTYLQMDSALTDRQAVEQMITHFKVKRPFYNYLVLNDCRDALLSLDEKRYYRAVATVDQALGDLVTYLRNENIYYSSIVVVTSPRSSSKSDQAPLILHGPGFQTGTRITDSMVIDVTPTICLLTGLNPPLGIRGMPCYDALLYTKEERAGQLNQWVKSLQEERTNNWLAGYRMQDEIYRNYHQISSMKEERQSIFDYAGQKDDAMNGVVRRLTAERIGFAVIFMLLLLGYPVEYYVLRKRFLLFK